MINVEFCEKHHKDIELVVIEADTLKNLASLFSICGLPLLGWLFQASYVTPTSNPAVGRLHWIGRLLDCSASPPTHARQQL